MLNPILPPPIGFIIPSDTIESIVPTLKPVLNANPTLDAQLLKKAYENIGCDERMVINIITHRNSAQREQIKAEYFKLYQKCLIKRTVSELYQPLEYLALCLLYTGPDADAYILRKATKGIGTTDSILIHVLCTRSSFQISKIKESYEKLYHKTLRQDVKGDTSGNHRKILLYLIDNPRSISPPDPGLASHQAASTYSRSTIKLSLSENLIPIFCQSSYEQIKLINQHFHALTGESLPAYFDKFLGNYEATLRTICLYALDPICYFACFLRQNILSNSIKNVICVIATRAEIDLASILNSYYRLYNSRAEDDIRRCCRDVNKHVIDAIMMLIGFM